MVGTNSKCWTRINSRAWNIGMACSSRSTGSGTWKKTRNTFMKIQNTFMKIWNTTEYLHKNLEHWRIPSWKYGMLRHTTECLCENLEHCRIPSWKSGTLQRKSGMKIGNNENQEHYRPRAPDGGGWGGGGSQQRLIFYTQKNLNFRICLSKKNPSIFSIPKKIPHQEQIALMLLLIWTIKK